MGSKFHSFQRSPLGVFVRSPLGVRNAGGGLMVIYLLERSEAYKGAGGVALQATDKAAWDAFTLANGPAKNSFLFYNDDGVAPTGFTADISNDAINVPIDIPAFVTPGPLGMDPDLFIEEIYDPAVAIFGVPDTIWILMTEKEIDTSIFDYDPALFDFQNDFLLADKGISSTVFQMSDHGGQWLDDFLHFRKFPFETPDPVFFSEFSTRVIGPVTYTFPP